MKKRNNNNLGLRTLKKKPKYWIMLLGIFVIVVSLSIAVVLNNNRLVRKNGVIVIAPIIEISYANKGGRSGTISINGNNVSIFALDNDFKVGDSIPVMYNNDKRLAVQLKFTENYFIVYFILNGVLLMMGLLLIYGGFMGKKFS